VREERRSVRARSDEEPRRVHFRDAAARGAEPGGRKPVKTCSMALLQPSARHRADCGGARVSAAIATAQSLVLWGSGRDALFGLQQRLAAQANLAGRVDVDDLDENLFALLQLVPHVLHAVVGDFRDMQQTV